jgi:hypothetical protein
VCGSGRWSSTSSVALARRPAASSRAVVDPSFMIAPTDLTPIEAKKKGHHRWRVMAL